MRGLGRVSVALVLALSLAQPGRAGEPVYQGKTLSQWTAALKEARPSTRFEAIQALRKMGAAARDAIPDLVGVLADKSSSVRAAAVGVLIDLGAPTVPALVEALGNPDAGVRGSASAVLGKMGAPAVPALAGALGSQNVRQRQGAAEVLGRMGGHAQLAVSTLAQAIHDADAEVRRRALHALGQIGAAAKAAVPALAKAVQQQDTTERYLAAAALAQIDPAQLPGVIPILVSAPNEQQTATVLARIGSPAVTALADALRKDRNTAVRRGAAAVLGQLGPAAESAVSTLAVALQDPDGSVRLQAATTLARLGRSARSALPALVRALQDSSPAVRSQAAQALGTLGPLGEEAIPALGKALDDADPSVRLQAANALDQIDPHRHQRKWLITGAVLLLTLAGLYGWWYRRLRRARRESDERHNTPLVERFAQLVRERDAPDLVFQFLGHYPEAAPELQRDVLLVDQAFRWRTGCPRPIQEYLDRCPDVAADSELILDLLTGECECARTQGVALDLAALLGPFPYLRDRVRERLAHLGGATVIEPRLTDGTATLVLASGPGAPPEALSVFAPIELASTGTAPPPAQAPAGPATVDHVPAQESAAPVALASGATEPEGDAAKGGLPSTKTHTPAGAPAGAAAVLASTTAPGGPPLPASPAGPKPPPERIGRYVIERVLGEGAFGTVYLARDQELRRTVAIKVPKRSRIATERDIEAYMAEARVLASLDHPGIVAVYDVGRTADGLCYVVSKHIQGSDLSKRLQQGQPSPVEAATIIAQAAEALEHAHQKGLVHRDVKPANLLLDRRGNVCVADFGLALTGADFEADVQIAGTPAYMSPEQARGEVQRLDGRSDLFSLGIVFFELLTGRRPFQGGNVTELIDQIQRREVSHLPLINARVPSGLIRICLKCLAKRPSERYRTAQDLALELRRWQKSAEAAELDPVALRIVPDQFQPFEARDADLYLELLAGPRAGPGLPDKLRFWKGRLEATDPGKTFRAGLLTGAPGAGKSSLVKAGLFPRLAEQVLPVYVAAPPVELLGRLQQALTVACPGFPASTSLEETFRRLRHEPAWAPDQKVLLVFDQFEQWFLTGGAAADADLVRALAHCDGGRLQCLLVVRDDFGSAAVWLLGRAGLAVVEGDNLARVEPFDLPHAQQVLTRVGRAFRRLPEDPADTTFDQRLFLDRAVTDLSRQGRVNPLRLAQFVALYCDLAWTPGVFSQMGGAQGSLVALLEDRFHGAQTDEQRRFNQAARALLTALLPREGAEGPGRSRRELLRVTHSEDRPREFARVLSILDHELRLITPLPPEQITYPGSAVPAVAGYRLADEDVAVAVRQWLLRKPGALRPRKQPRVLKQPGGLTPSRPGRSGRLASMPGRRSRLFSVSVRSCLGCLVLLGGLALVCLVVFFGLPRFKQLAQAEGGFPWSVLKEYWLAACGVAALVLVVVWTSLPRRRRRTNRHIDEDVDH